MVRIRLSTLRRLFRDTSKRIILLQVKTFHQKVDQLIDTFLIKGLLLFFQGYHQQNYHQYDPQAQNPAQNGVMMTHSHPQPQMMPQEIPQMPQVPTHDVPQPVAQAQSKPEPVEEAQLISFD